MEPKLLTRDEFRSAVFQRDQNRCVICKQPAQDAHHIIERRLFHDGGYYIDNGASLCGACHIKAEQTDFSVDEIRKAANIKTKILPAHLYSDNDYTKWGDIINSNGTRIPGELFYDESVQKILQLNLHRYLPYVKYPRTYHLPCSFGRTKDDRVLKDYSNFEGNRVIATIKMDGENTTFYSDSYIHARSIDGRDHESRSWVKQFANTKFFNLPKGWRVCGENLYAKHSIFYNDLKSYFYLFSIWNSKNECLSWDDTVEWAQLLEIDTVPVVYDNIFNQKDVEQLGDQYSSDTCEGFVLRNANWFDYSSFRNNVGKFVRSNHVQTNKHWLKTKLVPNQLKMP